MGKANKTLTNGTVITAEENATSLITDRKPDFPPDLSVVTVTGACGEHIYKNAEVIECASVDGRYWFSFREVSKAERAEKQLQANIEYIAMMTNVDLNEV